MNFEDALNIVSAALVSIGGGSILILGLSSFLGKVWAQRILGAERAKYELELEKYRDELSKLSFEHQFKFQRLHERRVDVISQTYSLLRTAYNAVQHLAFEPDDQLDKNVEIAKKAVVDLYAYFLHNRIYINYEVARKITSFQVELESTIGELEYHGYAYSHEDKFNRVQGKLSEALTDLELEFRGLLGESVSAEEL
ncbi:hypothetical protein [Vibrio vulnificus]|uniref:hypothetical protein n=1 Tax=Vibrio vulnificus TaxID=672 RepID=UPI000926F66C|nr:hypothetical protein [Vibrio vulnificus]ELJ9746468.1 hypothetical protein [Vibrio parahaemolyticus]OJI54105.1 hypothetical protein VFL11327_04342 [Vibrio fluvialis]EHH0751598.1 hypothetical protein [Vibrio vulnificus]ELK8511093.1 hypothetical protein [Vibrio vulnificus]ELK8997752.1 hypothetical protein [Vibrio vulnificus]